MAALLAAVSSVAADVRLVATGPDFARVLYERPGLAGAQEVPPQALHRFVETALVGVPLQGDLQLEVLEARAAATATVADVPEDLPLDGPARLEPTAMLRHQRVATLAFCPRRNEDGSSVIYDSVLVEVRFAPDPGRSPPPDGFEPSYRATLLNYDQARRWRAPGRVASKPAAAQVTPETGMFRVVVRGEGIYRVTADELERSGADLDGVAPGDIRLLYGGGLSLRRSSRVPSGVELRPVESIVEDGGDGRFDGEDHILFHGVGPERWEWTSSGYVWRKNPYTKDNVYWIDLDGAEEAPRAPEVQVAPNRNAAAVVDRYRVRLHEEDERLIARQLNGVSSGYEWFWKEFTGNARNFTFVVEDALPEIPVVARVRFLRSKKAAQAFDLRWNGEDLERTVFHGPEPYTIEMDLEGAQQGLNQLGLFHRASTPVRLDWYEVEYLRRLKARQGELLFGWPGPEDGIGIDSGADPVLEFRLEGFAGADGAPRIFEVSRRLRELTGFEYDAETGQVVFHDRFVGGRPPRYIAVKPGRWRRPDAVVRDTQPPRDPEGAEYVIVTHAEFASAARRLADWRAEDDRFGRPLTTMVVDVQNLYDEFSGGLLDPMAIRIFVAQAVRDWRVPPVYLTLLGDGTYDYKNNSGLSHTNWIPAYQDRSSTYDEWYARIAGLDRVPDLAVARIPVQSAAEADGVVDKILRYDQAFEPGPWQARILLVADDVSNPDVPSRVESFFVLDAERIARGGMPPDLDMTKFYTGTYPHEGRTKPGARDRFLSLFNEGALILTYIGHGHPEVLAHEQIFLLNRDVGRIDNGGRLPFVYTAASAVGVFDDPTQDSMPEVLLKMPDRGVIAFLSATRIGYHTSNMVLAMQFHRQMYRSGREHVPLGLALMEAKQVGVGDLWRTNIQRYSLFGDAAQRLARPTLAVALDLPDSMEALMELELTGTVIDAGGRARTGHEGEALVQLFDSSAMSLIEGTEYQQLGAPLFRGLVQVEGGRFRTRLRIPKDITYRASLGRASAYVTSSNGAPPAFGARSGLVLSGTAADVEPDDDGPTIELAFASRPRFRSGDRLSRRPLLAARLMDPSGINITGETGHEIELWVDDEVTAVTRFYTSLGDHRQGQLKYPLGQLEPGEHAIRLKAWDAFNNSSTAEATFSVASGDSDLEEVLFHPNPTPDGGGYFTYTLAAPAESVEIRVYALSGRQVASLEGGASLGFNLVRWSPAGLAGGTYLYRISARLEEGPALEADGRIQVAR